MGIKKGVKKYAGRRKPEFHSNTTLERAHTGGADLGGAERGTRISI